MKIIFKILVVLIIIPGFILSLNRLPLTGAYFERNAQFNDGISASVQGSALLAIGLVGSDYGTNNGVDFFANIIGTSFLRGNRTTSFRLGHIINNSPHSISQITFTLSPVPLSQEYSYLYNNADLSNDLPLMPIVPSNPTFSPSGNVSIGSGGTQVLDINIYTHHSQTTSGFYSGLVNMTVTVNGVNYSFAFPLRVHIIFA